MTHKIDTSGWKKFLLTDVFNMANTKSIVQNRIIPNSGKIPYVTASSENNGVMTYVDCPVEWIDKGNCIMIGGKSLTFTYQAQNFCSNDSHNIALYVKNESMATKVHYLFLIAALQAALNQRFNWSDSISMKRAEKESFYLPATSLGDPDWDFMDAYMSDILADELTYADELTKKNFAKYEIDTSGWKEFRVGKIFDMFKPPVLHDRQVIPSETGLPYVVRTKFNNGIKDLVVTEKDITPSPAGVITWGAENASFFYQEKPFYSGRDIYYLDTRGLSMNVCHFLAAVLSTVASRYPYNYGLFPNLLKHEVVKLPIAPSGDPDWEFMDNYMSKIMDEEKTVVAELTA